MAEPHSPPEAVSADAPPQSPNRGDVAAAAQRRATAPTANETDKAKKEFKLKLLDVIDNKVSEYAESCPAEDGKLLTDYVKIIADQNRPQALKALEALTIVLGNARDGVPGKLSVKTVKISKFGEGFVEYLFLAGFRRTVDSFEEIWRFPEDANRERKQEVSKALEVLKERRSTWSESHEWTERLKQREEAEDAQRAEKAKRAIDDDREKVKMRAEREKLMRKYEGDSPKASSPSKRGTSH